jgi:hypothetical protein
VHHLNDLEARATSVIAESIGVEYLALGRLRNPVDRSRSREELTAFWIVLVSSSLKPTAEFIARVDSTKCSTVIYGSTESATQIVQNPKQLSNLDRTVMHPDFSCDDDYAPTELGGTGPDLCRVVVRTWKCLAHYDFLGSNAYSKSPISSHFLEFRQMLDTT